MATVLMILGKETGDFAKGNYNQALFDTAVDYLSENHQVLVTVVENGYNIAEEVDKFKQADVVIYQYPIYWFMMPATLKRYIDDVYRYDEFFTATDGPYGSGGLMQGKQYMLSTTWNSEEEIFGDPDAFFEGAGVEDILLPMRKTHEYCGFEELPYFASHNIVMEPNINIDKDRLLEHLDQVFVRNGWADQVA